MPMPRWWTTVNKHLFNPMELRRGTRPVLTHTGRVSGATFRTPLDAHPVDGGYLFVLVYGSASDWVQNVVASGQASLYLDGRDIELMNPRLVDAADAWASVPEGTPRPPRMLRITELLRMDVVA